MSPVSLTFTALDELFLAVHKAPEHIVEFVLKGNLIGFPLDRIDEIIGLDEIGFIPWLKHSIKLTVYYDHEFERVCFVEDKVGFKITFDYDKEGRLTKESHPEGHSICYSYGEEGGPIGVTYSPSHPFLALFPLFDSVVMLERVLKLMEGAVWYPSQYRTPWLRRAGSLCFPKR